MTQFDRGCSLRFLSWPRLQSCPTKPAARARAQETDNAANNVSFGGIPGKIEVITLVFKVIRPSFFLTLLASRETDH